METRGSLKLRRAPRASLFLVALLLVAFLEQASGAPGNPIGAPQSSGVPAAPTNLRLVTTGVLQIGYEWDDNSDNEIDFHIEAMGWEDRTFRLVGFALAPAGLTQNLEPSTLYIFRVRARNAAGYSPYSNELVVSTATRSSLCFPNPEVLCLQNDRFEIRAYWESELGGRGRAKAVKLTPESGYFWFFNQENVEVLVKVLNGCVPNFRHWMFAAGLTDQRVIWTATDTLTGYVKTYQNPLKTQFTPVLDVNLGTCP